MKTKSLLIVLIYTLLMLSGCQKADPPPIDTPDPEIPEKVGYKEYSFSGFTVKILEDKINEGDAIKALKLIEENLKEVTELFPEHTLGVMKERPIWLEKNVRTDGAAWYHTSKEWLIQNGMNPDKAKCVEINNYKNYVDWTILNQPYMILHELSHLYHDLKLGFDNKEILDAYNNALDKKLYYKVKRYNGNNNYSEVDKAYALTTVQEYFAELSEAYFGLNDYFPYTKEELKEYDPKGYDVIDRLWNQE